MIARTWHGVVPEPKADAYDAYLRRTGIPDLQATPGNRGVYVLRRVRDGEAHFLLISLWESLDAIRAFAGDDVERALGRARYLAFYLLCGAIGGLVFVANDPHSTIELIGASGAIAGVVVGYVMLRPCAKITVLLGIIPLRISAYWVVGLFVLTQLWKLGASSKSEVAYWCHFGGMLGGAVLFPLLKPRAVKLFQCLQPVPDTVVQIGPNPAARAARLTDLR